jgi:hypothetical protein
MKAKDKKTAEEILENELNEMGFSFNDQLKPGNISFTETKKVKKSILKAMEEYHLLKQKEERITKRFTKPDDKTLVEIALLFNDGKIQKSKLRDMVAMSEFIIDRLYENGDVSKPSSKE